MRVLHTENIEFGNCSKGGRGMKGGNLTSFVTYIFIVKNRGLHEVIQLAAHAF